MGDGGEGGVDVRSYEDFLASKAVLPKPDGLAKGAQPALCGALYRWQREIVSWALWRGRAAIFADCGLGKTLMQLSWASALHEACGVDVLILTPLAVAAQTVREAARFGIESVSQVRTQRDVEPGISVANYEMLHKLDCASFGAVVLDESSILKAFTGKTKMRLVEAFSATRYRLACTATPAPNDVLELGNHSEFLGVMDSHEMLASWFQNDSMVAGGYRLRGWAEVDYWQWVASWAVSVRRPSDMGCDDEGYALPELRIHDVCVETDPERARQRGLLFAPGRLSATELWREKRATLAGRVAAAAEIVAGEPGEPWLIWCDTNYEADALKVAIPEAVEVRGSDSLEVKRARLEAFSDGESRILITKPDIAGHGLNWQHCARQVFVGVTYSFEKYYQAVRRSWRYGQRRPVDVHVVYAESEGDVVDRLRHKQSEHETMHEQMRAAIGAGALKWRRDLSLTDTEERVTSGDGWTLYLGDCVTSMRHVEDESVGLSVFSPPFKDLYVYSDKLADMGNSAGDDDFFEHFAFLVGELHRATMPGRLCCVHCKDLPTYKGRDGAAGIYDFPGRLVALFEAHGWTFHSRVTIWKDPVIEAARTNNHGLLHKNFTSRREVCRMGMADYVLCFRKHTPEMPDKQISHPSMPGEFIGGEPPAIWRSDRDWSIQTWQRYASPVWMDIRQTNVLGGGRDERDEKHICPLQLDVIERCVWLWSNEGDLVLSPFAGIGSEGYVATQMRRRFVGIELKESYYNQALKHLRAAEREASQLTLFDAMGGV